MGKGRILFGGATIEGSAQLAQESIMSKAQNFYSEADETAMLPEGYDTSMGGTTVVQGTIETPPENPMTTTLADMTPDGSDITVLPPNDGGKVEGSADNSAIEGGATGGDAGAVAPATEGSEEVAPEVSGTEESGSSETTEVATDAVHDEGDSAQGDIYAAHDEAHEHADSNGEGDAPADTVESTEPEVKIDETI